jgi:hypothetical protein
VTGTEVAIDTTAATADFNMAGVCDPGPYGDDVVHNLIVFSWSPKVQGRYTLSTCNIADFDTRLAVISTCDGATVVGCNDDATGCANFTSELTVDVDAGQEYYILVGGYSEADVGTGTMTITPFEVELTLQGAHRWEKSAGGNGKWYAKYAVNAGSTWEAIRAKAESMGGTLACANVASENTLLGSIYQATGSGARTAFGLYQDLADPAYAEPLGGWKWVDGGALGYSTWANGEPNDFNGVEHYGQFVAYYFGEFWNDNYDTNAWTHVLVEFAKAQPGFTAPPNDEPAGATPLAAEQVVTVSLVGATTSATELVCEDPLFYDRWYTFTPAATDSYDIVGCGNGFDGSVAIYDSASNLVGCSGGVCTLQLSLTGGQTYLVRIGSPAGDSAGNPTISIAPSPDIVSLDAISVNFVGGTYIDGADGGRCNNSATTPVGANAWGTLNWSNLVGASDGAAAGYAANGNGDAPTALRDGYGEATTAAVSFTVNNPWRIYSFPANDTDRMRRGYLDSNTLSAINVTVSGVPYANYAVVVYFGADGPDRVGSASATGSAPVYRGAQRSDLRDLARGVRTECRLQRLPDHQDLGAVPERPQRRRHHGCRGPRGAARAVGLGFGRPERRREHRCCGPRGATRRMGCVQLTHAVPRERVPRRIGQLRCAAVFVLRFCGSSRIACLACYFRIHEGNCDMSMARSGATTRAASPACVRTSRGKRDRLRDSRGCGRVRAGRPACRRRADDVAQALLRAGGGCRGWRRGPARTARDGQRRPVRPLRRHEGGCDAIRLRDRWRRGAPDAARAGRVRLEPVGHDARRARRRDAWRRNRRGRAPERADSLRTGSYAVGRHGAHATAVRGCRRARGDAGGLRLRCADAIA